ncbi:MAG: tetratricopeptide repeat protein [Mariprofundaceae bacterium]|nr:tetratricopeptide repeat protein [Mariprofundaceae bacterium]
MRLKIGVLLLSMTVLISCVGTSAMDDLKNKKRANAHFNIGLDALRNNNLTKAFDELMQANQLLPNQPLVLDSLGNAWRVQGDIKKAEAYFKHALKYGDIPSIHTNYASLLVQLERYQEAKNEINLTLDDPRYPRQDLAYMLLGDALVGLGELDEGVQAYRRAAQINPRQQIVSQLREALVYVNSGRYSYAVALYETILRKYPANRAALEGLLPLLKQQGEDTAAKHYLLVFEDKVSDVKSQQWASDQLLRLPR